MKFIIELIEKNYKALENFKGSNIFIKKIGDISVEGKITISVTFEEKNFKKVIDLFYSTGYIIGQDEFPLAS